MHVYIPGNSREELDQLRALYRGRARARTVFLGNHGVEGILNRCLVARTIVGASATLVDVSRMLSARITRQVPHFQIYLYCTIAV
jgi:hypothetical protein